MLGEELFEIPFLIEVILLMQCARKIFSVFPKVDKSQEEYICYGIQVNIGAFLASYTFHTDQGYKVLPFMFSAVAIGGSYHYLEMTRKNSKPKIRMWSWWDLANGIFTFTTSVYAFSEGLACNDRMWIPCLLLAASGLCNASTTVGTLDMFLNRRPFMKCCQLMFEPALVACASTYLFHFRGHNQGWLKCLPFLVIGNAGYHIADRGCRRVGRVADPSQLVLKVIEMFLGGCYLSISCASLAICTSANDFSSFCTVFMSFGTICGMFVIYCSILWFQECVEMEAPVFFCISKMISGPIVFLTACISVRCIYWLLIFPVFMITAGTGIYLLGKSILDLRDLVPQPVFERYCRRVLGPLVTVYGSLFTAYVGYNMGWRCSLLMVPLIPAGIYATYQGYKRRNQP